jgi:hypothetical protein
VSGLFSTSFSEDEVEVKSKKDIKSEDNLRRYAGTLSFIY